MLARHDVFRGFVFSDFVTCPCRFRTKRHDNLFVYDDDDDDDDDDDSYLKTWNKIGLTGIQLLVNIA